MDTTTHRHPPRTSPAVATRALVLAVVSVLLAGTLLSPANPASANGAGLHGRPTGAVAVLGVGASFSCVLQVDGGVKCWGTAGNGQLGLGDDEARGDRPGEMGDNLPNVNLGTGRTARLLAVGDYHSCALLDDASVKCWGLNIHGELGVGDTTDRGKQPTHMGDNLPRVDLGTGRTARAISAGGAHTCAVRDDGSVVCWGNGAQGRLGSGDTARIGDQPGEMGDALRPVDLGTGRTATAVSAGYAHTCALLDDHSVKCWGQGVAGQLGNGSTASIGDQPGEMGDALAAIDLGPGRTARAVSAGVGHTCAILDDGGVVCWGDNVVGELGRGDTVRVGTQPGQMGANLVRADLRTGRTAVAVDASWSSTCVVRDDHSVVCFGFNAHGRLGVGSTQNIGDQPGEMGDALVPVALGTNRSARTVALSGHACAVLDVHRVKCWGEGLGGRLGLGNTASLGDEPGELGDNLPYVALGTGSGKLVMPVVAAPAPPSNVAATPAPGAVSLSWTAPTDDGGGPVSGYRIQRSTNGVTWSTVVANTGSTSTTASVGSLTPGQPIRIRVAAINAAGLGPMSLPSNVVTPANVPAPPGGGGGGSGGDGGGGGTTPGAEFVALVPARVLDTRPGGTTADGELAGSGAIAGGSEIVVPVAGRVGVPDDAAAVSLNMTVNDTGDAGYVTVYPCGSTRPNASNVNYSAGQTIPNAVVVTVGDEGSVCVFTDQPTHLIADLNGYVPAGADYVALEPARLLDTRAPGGATIDGALAATGALAGGDTVELPVTGRGGVPADASSVVLNVAVTAPADAGYVTVYPCGAPRPNASNLNYVAGQTIANAVIVKTGDQGRVCLFSDQTTDLVVDVNGAVPGTDTFAALQPARLLDTRAPGGATIDGALAATGALAGGDTVELPVTGRGGVPADASSVVLNVAVTAPADAGYVTVYPCGAPRPNASNLNYVAGQTIANAVIVKTGDQGRVCLFSDQTTDLVVDVNGVAG